MAFISIFFIFIISDHGSIFCGFAGWKNSDGYIQCQARDWICGEWLKHNHTNTKRETNQSMQTLTGFLLDNCDTYIFFRLKWPTLEKHPLVPALEVVVEPKLNTELANKNFHPVTRNQNRNWIRRTPNPTSTKLNVPSPELGTDTECRIGTRRSTGVAWTGTGVLAEGLLLFCVGLLC